MIRRAVTLASVASLAAAFALVPATAQTINDVDLVDPASEAQGPIANINARLAYNTDLGPLLGLGVQTDRLFGDHTLRFGVELSEDSQRYDLFYRAPALFGDNPVFGLSLFAAQTDQSEAYGFDSATVGVEPRLTWSVQPNLQLSTYVGLSRGEISNVPATTSILIRNDAGARTRTVLGAELNGRVPGGSGGLQGLRYGLTAEAGQDDNNHRFTSVSGRATAGWALGAQESLFLRASVRSGVTNSTQGTTHIGDRAFLGQASLRGFAFGGFGPRDLSVADQPALGGNAYAIARFDAQFPTAIEGGRLLPGVFVDVGSLWGLDDTAGGLAGANPVDDSFGLRASAGLSLQIGTGFGPITLNWAHPFQSESYDRTEEFSLSFMHRF